jgi:hypothetical protein
VGRILPAIGIAAALTSSLGCTKSAQMKVGAATALGGLLVGVAGAPTLAAGAGDRSPAARTTGIVFVAGGATALVVGAALMLTARGSDPAPAAAPAPSPTSAPSAAPSAPEPRGDWPPVGF